MSYFTEVISHDRPRMSTAIYMPLIANRKESKLLLTNLH